MKRFILAVIFLSLIPSLMFAQLDAGVVTDISNIPLNQDNPVVSISRTDKNTIVIGAASDDMDSLGMPVYFSSDKGLSWQNSRLPFPLNADFYVEGEPSVATNSTGNFYYAYITNDGVDSDGNISIAISHDAGKTWSNGTPLTSNNTIPGYPDGVFITVDNSASSQHKGRIYAVWDQFFSAPDSSINEGLYVAWSDDEFSTWSAPKLLGPTDDYQEVKTGKNGEVYVSASDSLGIGHQLFVSTNFGATFTNPAEFISGFSSYPLYATDTEFTLLKGITGFAAFPYVSFDVDLTSNRIHAVYGDYQADVATLYYQYSDNNGSTWSDPIGIQELSSSDRFDPWVSVDQITRETYVMFYSSDSDPNNILVAPYRLRIRDSAEQMLNAAFNPLTVENPGNAMPYIGDHTYCDAFDSIFIGVWTQNRSGRTDGDVYAFVSTQKQNDGVEQPFVIHSQSSWLSSPYPNPSNGKNISLRYYVPQATEINFDLFDITGRSVKHFGGQPIEEGSYSGEFDISNVSAGTYFIRMTTNEGAVSQKLIIP
jgi:hypothetical protein